MAENTTVTSDTGISEFRAPGVSPGNRLQAARIQQGLSLEDVASRMRLSVDIVAAIEDNDFDRIIAPIFAKGYLRSYSRLVAIDEAEIIQLYCDIYSEADPPIASTSNMVPQLTSTDARIKWTTYLVVVVLGALLVAWWWNAEQHHESPISLDAQAPLEETSATTRIEMSSDEIGVAAENQPISDPDLESPLDLNSEPEAESGVNLPSRVGQSEDSAEAPLPAAAGIIDPVEPGLLIDPADSEQSSSRGSEDGNGALTGEESESSVEPGPLPTVQALQDIDGARLTRIAPKGTDKLVIIVRADTWIDIKDGADTQMAYNLLRAGQIMEVTGEAPFSMLLGNGYAVEVTFNGENVELLSRVRTDNTVRVQVGG